MSCTHFFLHRALYMQMGSLFVQQGALMDREVLSCTHIRFHLAVKIVTVCHELVFGWNRISSTAKMPNAKMRIFSG